jgi:negative regulator of sigma E activity
MSDEILSALLDGECSPEELDRLLDEMERSPELKRSYSRLCAAREAAEGTRIARQQPCICADVMGKLDAEPLPFSDKLSDLDARRRRQRLWKPLAGLAAAASVAAMAVVVVVPESQQRQGGGSPGLFGAPQISQPVSLPLPATSRPRNLQMVSAQADEIAQEDDLSNYLMEHSNTAAGRGMGGTLSYARFTAHNAVYRPQVEEQR